MGYNELRHLQVGASHGEAIPGVGLDSLRVQCADDAEMVLSRVKESLKPVIGDHLNEGAKNGPKLPSWFVESFSEGSEALRRFRSGEPSEDQERWTIEGWRFWFDPDERMWRWWDSVILSPDTFEIRLVALDWPTPTGALKWLLYAAGAKAVEFVD